MGKHFSSLNFRHSISVTHHSSLITHHSSLIFSHSFGNITFIFITQFFHTIHGSHTCQLVQCFFFFLVPNSPRLIFKKKKKKTNKQTNKQTANANPGKEKKKSKNGQKLRLWVLYVCLITILLLSDGNRVMETKLLFAKQIFYYGSHHFLIMSYGNRKLSYQKTQSKQAISCPKPNLRCGLKLCVTWWQHRDNWKDLGWHCRGGCCLSSCHARSLFWCHCEWAISCPLAHMGLV